MSGGRHHTCRILRACAALLLVIMTLLWAAPPAAVASELARRFLDGVAAYRAGDYPEAIAAFSAIAENGAVNAPLFYNLGNAHLKNGDLGHAILWYERALRLDTHDPDLKFNHAHALSLVKDEREGRPAAWLRVLFFWNDLLGRTMIARLAVVLNALFWAVLAFRLARRKRPLRGLAPALLALALVFALTASFNAWHEARARAGVILKPAVSVRSGLSEAATELFVLHAGSRVRVTDEKGDYVKVRFAPDKIGWLRREDVGII